MARYTGAVCRLCRRQGEKLFLKGERCFTPKCAIERRNNPPGQHGTARRRRLSERGMQLREKQKARFIFGVLEKQFRRHYQMATKRPGARGENLLQELELRLDNVCFRLGFADSRNQARQVVLHGHITLNGRKTDIPSARTKVGDVIGWVPKSVESEYFKYMSANLGSKTVPDWLDMNMTLMTGRVQSIPMRSQMEHVVNEQAIVEFYSR